MYHARERRRCRKTEREGRGMLTVTSTLEHPTYPNKTDSVATAAAAAATNMENHPVKPKTRVDPSHPGHA